MRLTEHSVSSGRTLGLCSSSLGPLFSSSCLVTITVTFCDFPPPQLDFPILDPLTARELGGGSPLAQSDPDPGLGWAGEPWVPEQSGGSLSEGTSWVFTRWEVQGHQSA